jgi:hypothetical protein
VTTYGFSPPGPISTVQLLSGSHTATVAPVVLLSSGQAVNTASSYGDAMFGTYLGTSCPYNSQQMWSVNDLATAAELNAPLFGHGLYNQTGTLTYYLMGTELPYELQGTENPVEYNVDPSATVVALSGNIPINGGLYGGSNSQCAPNSYISIGNGTVTPTGWSQTFTVSSGQSGNVMFLLKTRVLDCNANEGYGTAKLQLVLDSTAVGSIGIQQWDYNNTCHQRTLTASYLALGLSVGSHTINGTFTVTGLPNLSASGDLALVYFGN